MEKAFVYKHLRLEGTREALIVFFSGSKIFTADEIQGVGKELLRAADLAARIDMPLVVSFQAVESISSAFVGKWIVLNKKARSNGIKLRFRDMSPVVEEVFRRTLGGEGPAL